MYLDYTDEVISMYKNVPSPPLFVIHSPQQFDEWLQWAGDFKEDNYKGVIQPFGMEFDIEDGIDGFISYYDGLKGRNNGS